MERMRIAAIFADQESLGGKDVTVCGWARTIRDMKTFGFIELNDGSCFKNLQVVMSAEELANYKDIAAQNVGAALIVKGTVVLTPDAKQPLEVKAHSIAVEGKSTPELPEPCRRSATAWNSCGPSSTCGPVPTCSPPRSGYAPWRPTRCMSFSRAGVLCMYRPPSSPAATARVPARCSR